MKSYQDYKEDTNVTLLLQGPPGSGKTTAAYCFPSPYFISTDHKFGNAIKIHGQKEMFYDYPDVDDAGKVVPPEQRFDRVRKLALAAGTDPRIKTIVLDNLTDVGDYLMWYLLSENTSNPRPTVAGMKVMNQADWGPFAIHMMKLITGMKLLGKNVVVCCHEDVEKDEVTGTLTYRPFIGGQTKQKIGSWFSNVWRCEAKPEGTDKVKYYVRTIPTPRAMLINGLGVPSEFNVTAEELSKFLTK